MKVSDTPHADKLCWSVPPEYTTGLLSQKHGIYVLSSKECALTQHRSISAYVPRDILTSKSSRITFSGRSLKQIFKRLTTTLNTSSSKKTLLPKAWFTTALFDINLNLKYAYCLAISDRHLYVHCPESLRYTKNCLSWPLSYPINTCSFWISFNCLPNDLDRKKHTLTNYMWKHLMFSFIINLG